MVELYTALRQIWRVDSNRIDNLSDWVDGMREFLNLLRTQQSE